MRRQFTEADSRMGVARGRETWGVSSGEDGEVPETGDGDGSTAL